MFSYSCYSWRHVAGLLALLLGPGLAWADEAVRLREEFAPGYQYHVSTRTDLTGTLSLPPEKNPSAAGSLKVTGNGAIEYDERVLAVGANREVQKTMRIYRRLDFERKVGERPQQSSLRQGMRRLVLLRHQNTEVPFSPDGALTWGEIDLVRTDVFTPALAGLLPERAVRPNDRWTATPAAIQELTDMERIEEGQVECRFQEITTLQGRRYARISFAGTVRGINEDGPNRQKLEGYYFFDLQSNHLSYLTLQGVSSLLDKNGQVAGSIQGTFTLTRQAHQQCADLTDQALRGVVLEPNAVNTQLLYENPDLGLRFLHPRRWRVAGVHDRRVALDEANGSGLLLTVEVPARVPNAAVFLAEARQYLVGQQKVKVLRDELPRRLQFAPQELDHFSLDVTEPSGQRVLMHYYVARQPLGGVTVAARLLPADLATVASEVEQIARSIVITRALPEGTK